MAQIEKVVCAIHIVDIAIIVVRPPSRPRLHDLEVVPAIGKMRMAFHHSDMVDGEMVLVSKVLFPMGIIDAALLVLIPVFVAPFFLLIVTFILPDFPVVSIISIIVVMLVLGYG
jgi:hypothetical protein